MKNDLIARQSKPSVESGEAGLQVPALQRGLALLELLAGAPEGATLSELGTSLRISLTSVFRLAGALEELGYVRREEKSKRYAVTQKLLLLGQPHSGTRSLVECSLGSMRRILAVTGETTQLCCLAQASCVVLEQLAARHPFKYVVDLGSRPPTYCCAPGKAMLAYLPEAEFEALVQEIAFERHTERTLMSRHALLVERERIRACGYAIDHGEHFDGLHCVAAPLLDRHGYPLAAITIAGPATRIPPERFAEYGPVIAEAAAEAARSFLS